MSYERGYCRPECAKCAEVCPTDAIHLADLTEKSCVPLLKVGTGFFNEPVTH